MRDAIEAGGNERAMKTLLHAQAKPSSEKVKWDDTCYEAEITLSMAAWNCDIDTLELLINEGATLNSLNSKEENVLHSLIEVQEIKANHKNTNLSASSDLARSLPRLHLVQTTNQADLNLPICKLSKDSVGLSNV